jgi:hypothetical protein
MTRQITLAAVLIVTELRTVRWTKCVTFDAIINYHSFCNRALGRQPS